MPLGLYSTTLAAQRLPSVFKFSRFGRMTNRGMVSRAADGNHINPRNSLTDNEQPHLWKNTFEKDFPSLSASFSSKPAGKRRTRIDLTTPSQQNAQNIDRMQAEPSTSISHQYDTDLPTDFGNKHTPPPRNPNLWETHHECGESKTSLNFSPSTTLEIRESNPQRRFVNEKNSGKLEAVQNIDLMQVEVSASISHQYDTDLPDSFGKKRTPHPRHAKLRETYHERGESKRGSMLPFDICFPEIRKSNTQREIVYEKNCGKRWVSKVQSAEENEQQKCDEEDNNDIEDSVEENGQVLRPGMVLFKRYIPISEQVDIVNRCRELGCGPGGFYRPGYEDGAKLRLHMMCLGQDWNPQTRKYGETRQHDNVTPPDIPFEFDSLVNRVLNDSHTLIKRDVKIVNVEDVLPVMSPDVCIVNFYTTTGRLGLHQDRDESPESLLKGLPVVSISIGDSADFLYSDHRDVDKAEPVLLESGDVLVFGGESRHVFHGVKTIIPKTAPRALLRETGLRPGRLNLTFRKY